MGDLGNRLVQLAAQGLGQFGIFVSGGGWFQDGIPDTPNPAIGTVNAAERQGAPNSQREKNIR